MMVPFIFNTIGAPDAMGREDSSVTDKRDIRAVRDRLGLSTAQLAQLVGVKYRTAHRWMEGHDVPEPVWRLLEMHEKYPGVWNEVEAMTELTIPDIRKELAK